MSVETRACPEVPRGADGIRSKTRVGSQRRPRCQECGEERAGRAAPLLSHEQVDPKLSLLLCEESNLFTPQMPQKVEKEMRKSQKKPNHPLVAFPTLS